MVPRGPSPIPLVGQVAKSWGNRAERPSWIRWSIEVRTMNIRCLLPVVLLILAGCGTHPPKATVPPKAAVVPVAPRAATEPVPFYRLGSRKERILAIADREWRYFGKQEVIYQLEGESIPHVGYWEDDDDAHIRRVSRYWSAVNLPTISGADCNQAWSAAFISWVMQESGVPEELFPSAKAHWMYLSEIISRDRGADTAFYPRTIREYKPKPGDLICASREPTFTPNIAQLPRPMLLANAKLHCDIVVATAAQTLAAIGGNVRNSVSKSILKLTPEGHLQQTPARQWFLIIENRLD